MEKKLLARENQAGNGSERMKTIIDKLDNTLIALWATEAWMSMSDADKAVTSIGMIPLDTVDKFKARLAESGLDIEDFGRRMSVAIFTQRDEMLKP